MGTRSRPGPSRRLGKYQLIERLAVGGMAEIFLARAVGIEGFQKLVVCKCILPQRAADADFVRMFIDEARLAAALHHPNIVQAFDIGCEEGLHFFTMEYVQGADVREILQAAQGKGGVPLEQAISIALGVAAGLHYAHEKLGEDGQPLGIVHRDVSPSNVLVSFDGGVKIMDFGIAKASVQGAHTQTGTTKGKVSCMAPEQCRGEAVDRRTDVFALGVLLYELTTGVRPFQGDTEYAIIRQIVDEDAASPTVHRPDYPPALAAIVSRALRRDRDERYASTQELQIDLEAFAQQQGLAVSSVELARYMHELFGGQRPRRVDEVAERFLHAGLGGDSDGDGSELAIEVASPPPHRFGRSTVATAAVLTLAALAGGGYWLGARNRGMSPSSSSASSSTAAAARTELFPLPSPPAAPAPTVFPAVAASAPGSGAPADAIAREMAPVRQAPARSPAGVGGRRRQARGKPTAGVHAARRDVDLDAPFPR